MNTKTIAFIGVVAASFAANAFAGSCCASKKASADCAAVVAKADKKDGSCPVSSCAKDGKTTGSCEKK